MAKFVVAGRESCPYYVRAELLGDKLAENLPNFNVYKIVKRSAEWKEWLYDICKKKNWQHNTSPIVWRELVDRGGKGFLIGGSNEFEEYAYNYYGVTIDLNSKDMKLIAYENQTTMIKLDIDAEKLKINIQPLKLCITNSSNPICCSLVDSLISGEIFGPDKDIFLCLFDNDISMVDNVQSIAMDIQNMAHGSLLKDVLITSNLEKAFQDCRIIIFLDEIKQEKLESRYNWLKRNADVFSLYAKTLKDVARKNTIVLVAGEGYINFNINILTENVLNIPSKNFIGVSKFLENQAKLVLADELKVSTSSVANVVIWGSINSNYLVDLQKTSVYGCDCSIIGPTSFSLPLNDVLHIKKWLKYDYDQQVQTRKCIVEKYLKHPEYNLHARAILSTLSDWWNGSYCTNIFSIAIASEGWYGVPEGLVFSFPVRMSSPLGYTVVQDMDFPYEFEQKINQIIKVCNVRDSIAVSCHARNAQ